ncbi:hypothetical protein [Paraburkholderia sp.]|uniref:hypothetical protein n=1 Tax=Paraburkholderia sp. TaxID=1926495 RepID=UPI0025E3C02E|nr:hypothetical protein [Paraburkholderia sp.]
MTGSDQRTFATTAACAAAFPFLAGHMVAGFSELARLNLSMYAAVLVGVQNNRESLLPLQTPVPHAWSQTGGLPPFAAQFAVPTSTVIEMTLQTSAALNRFALDGYVETVRHATAAIAAMARSVRIVDVMMKSAIPVSDDSDCAVAAIPPATLQDSARKDVDSVAGAAPTARRRRRP